jgi:tartrate dehydrogenase/decarboxylase/D-malate dehydrogenase
MTLAIRQRLDLWANLRPARLLPGPLHHEKSGTPPTYDMLFLHENTEGEYAGVGGRSHRGLPIEVGIETSVFTRVRSSESRAMDFRSPRLAVAR